MQDRRRLAGALALLLFAAASRAQDAGPGDPVPDHEFAPLAGHDGRTRLAELVGQPVLLAGWKRHFSEGLEAASLADTLYRSYEDDGLLVVLQDREKWIGSPSWIVNVDFWYRFYGTPLWITESPGGENDPAIAREHSALDTHSLVLIGVDGRLVFEATIDTSDERAFKKQRRELEAMVKAETARRKRGWGEDTAVRKARAAAYGKGDLAAAWKLLDGAEGDEPVALREELDRHFAARQKMVAFLLGQGRFAEAQDDLRALAKSVRGRDQLEAALEPLTRQLESDEGRAALALEKQLDRILRPYLDRELDDLDLELMRKLRAFAEKHGDSPIAERVRRLDPLLTRIVRILRGISAKDIEKQIGG